MNIFGTIYYEQGRYGYGAIDCTHEKSSGCSTIMTGIKPNKLAKEFCSHLQREQLKTLEDFSLALMIGESANSEELYLYTTNTREIYESDLKLVLKRLKSLLDTYSDHSQGHFGRVRYRHELETPYRYAYQAFKLGSERYEKEFPKATQDEWYNFTPLDIAVCAHQYIQDNIAEWEINKLGGYE